MAWLQRLARSWRGSHPLVAVVTLRGQIGPPTRGPRKALNADRAAPWLDRAFGLKPTAVALRINSPGGSPAQTELLVAAVRRRAEASGTKVLTFAEDVAASGGYWLLAGAATAGAYALPTSVVGSVGVIAPSFGAVDALHRLGLERRVFTAGEAKAGVDPFRPVAPSDLARLQAVLDDLHASFKAAVADARGPALAAAAAAAGGARPVPDADLYSGRVFTGRQAAEAGLVDGLGDVHTVCRRLFGEPAFVDCGERLPGAGLFGLGGAGGAAAAAVHAVADALDERAAWARWGVAG